MAACDANVSHSSEGKCILCIGLVCVDLIAKCDGYPEEDTDRRCLEIIRQRGGNASNTSTVLSELGAAVELMAVVPNTPELSFIVSDLDRCRIGRQHLVHTEDQEGPLTICILNQQNGSRTIMHTNSKSREVSFAEFSTLDLLSYRWIHLESRGNHDEQEQMLKHIIKHNCNCADSEKISISVEVEKPKYDTGNLIPHADIVFISKDFARYKGCASKEDAARYFVSLLKDGASVICPWGEEGAAACSKQEPEIVHTTCAYQPRDYVIDTLAAGDCFNAAVILSLSSGFSIPDALSCACQVAGMSVCRHGLIGLQSDLREMAADPQYIGEGGESWRGWIVGEFAIKH